jgi:hypothetical protein
MASIMAQAQDEQHISLTASNGKTVTVTAAEVNAYIQASVSEDRQTDALAWIKNRVVAALGDDSIAVGELFVDIDIANGQFRSLEVIPG